MQTQNKPRNLLSKIVLGIVILVVACCALVAIGSQFTNGIPQSSTLVKSTTQANNIVVKIYTPSPTVDTGLASQPTDTPAPPPTRASQPTGTSPAPGSSKDNPVQIGTPTNAKEFSIAVNRVVRPANKVVAAGNMFNKKPESGQEYVQVFVTITCTADAKTKCSTSPYDFKMSGSKGIVYKPEIFVAGVDGMLERTEFYGGAKLEKKSLFFLVGQGEANLVLEFEAGLFFRESAFFAVPDHSQ